MLLLFAIHTRLGPTLQANDFCLYVNFVGPKACGKSNCTKYLTEICHGKSVQSATESWILHSMDNISKNGGVVSIDQLDDKAKAMENFEHILEIGNTWSAETGVMEPGAKGKWNMTTIRCGGPKIFNSLVPPRPPLRSRTYEIEVYETQSPIYGVNFGCRQQDVMDINASLDAMAAFMKGKYKIADIRQHLLEESNLEKLKSLRQKSDARRDDMANVFEAINWMSGWSVDVFDALSRERTDEECDVFKYIVKSCVVSRYLNANYSGEIASWDLLQMVNSVARDYGLERMNPTTVGRKMSELGFNSFRVHKDDGTHYLLNDRSMGLLGYHRIIQQTLNTSGTLAKTVDKPVSNASVEPDNKIITKESPLPESPPLPLVGGDGEKGIETEKDGDIEESYKNDT